jgi:hypothetical protein
MLSHWIFPSISKLTLETTRLQWLNGPVRHLNNPKDAHHPFGATSAAFHNCTGLYL